jgi:hypothetical protein
MNYRKTPLPKKPSRAVEIFLRILDMPMHIFFFRFAPVLVIVTGLITAAVMYAVFYLQNLARWMGDSIDKFQAFISIHWG